MYTVVLDDLPLLRQVWKGDEPAARVALWAGGGAEARHASKRGSESEATADKQLAEGSKEFVTGAPDIATVTRGSNFILITFLDALASLDSKLSVSQ